MLTHASLLPLFIFVRDPPTYSPLLGSFSKPLVVVSNPHHRRLSVQVAEAEAHRLRRSAYRVRTVLTSRCVQLVHSKVYKSPPRFSGSIPCRSRKFNPAGFVR
jgi:hypothetical protein